NGPSPVRALPRAIESLSESRVVAAFRRGARQQALGACDRPANQFSAILLGQGQVSTVRFHTPMIADASYASGTSLNSDAGPETSRPLTSLSTYMSPPIVPRVLRASDGRRGPSG